MSEQNWRPSKRVAIIGGDPGGMSTALVFIKRGYYVCVFERQSECRTIGGAVLLSTPVSSILRSFGLETVHFGFYTVTMFNNDKERERVKLQMWFILEVERMMESRDGTMAFSAYRSLRRF